jgi:hypothetical protein
MWYFYFQRAFVHTSKIIEGGVGGFETLVAGVSPTPLVFPADANAILLSRAGTANVSLVLILEIEDVSFRRNNTAARLAVKGDEIVMEGVRGHKAFSAAPSRRSLSSN